MPRRVLIVEDEPDIQEIERMVAEDLLECEVAVASTGEEALQKAAQVVPDLVVLDLVLPGIDGFTVASRIRTEPKLKGTCILALSGLTRPEDRERALSAGCDAVQDKPFDLDDLTRKMEELLNRCAPAGS